MNDLILNLHRVHTTAMGKDRIKRNLDLDVSDVVEWCCDKIKSADAVMERKGKNWYVLIGNCRITVNAHSYTIITANRMKK